MVSRGTKRRIERVTSFISERVIGDVDGGLTLHEAEDSKTLIRIKVDMVIVGRSAGTAYRTHNLRLAVGPRGINVLDELVIGTDQLDNPCPYEEIASHDGVVIWDTDNNMWASDRWDIDTKGMRKLKVGDKLLLRYIGNTASGQEMNGTIYMWFKE